MKRDLFLEELANIRFGLNSKASINGTLPYIQGKDFDSELQLLPNNVYKLSDVKFSEKDLLQKGEVLFSGKGSRNYAVVWNNEFPDAVASSTFFVLRLINDIVLPEFLAWYLNSDIAKNYFKPFFIGVTIPNITKKVLSELKVVVPDIETQELIVSANALIKEEKILLKELAEKKEKVFDQLLIDALNRIN